MAAAENTVALSDLTKALRAEIDKMIADLEAGGKEAMLALEAAEIELTFGVEVDKSGKAGVSFKVFGIGFEGGGGVGKNDTITQKMKLYLKPIGNEDVGVADD